MVCLRGWGIGVVKFSLVKAPGDKSCVGGWRGYESRTGAYGGTHQLLNLPAASWSGVPWMPIVAKITCAEREESG
jgi:hypothetical protein